jgi:preprotein translocase subunit SecA
LRSASIPHEVLNARNDEAEARIIAQAGALGAVTISTNMAGRGTDIVPGGNPPHERERVLELGGLYVIGTNRHESRRIDHQLRGRAGRQGDPGSSRFFISLEDDLLVRFGIRELLAGTGFRVDRGAISDDRVTRGIESVQRMVEQENLEIRRTLWKYEKGVEEQRSLVRERRMEILEGKAPSLLEIQDPERHAELVRRFGQKEFDCLERNVRLAAIDDAWAEHLAAVSDLRSGIHWLAWGGREPLHAFWNEVIRLFEEMTKRVEQEVLAKFGTDDTVETALNPVDRGATWTYLVNDNPFGSMTDRLAQGLRRKLRERRLFG